MNDRIDFVVAGAQKAGTTALDAYLRRHPALCMADKKEVHFFDREECFAGGAPDYAAYHRHFDWSAGDRLRGEVTPIYMYWQDSPRRMWEYSPALRIIMLLRDPAERAWSHWRMERARNAETLEFGTAIRSEGRRCREALPLQHRVYSYIDRGFYTEQLRRVWRYFPPRQTLVLKQRDLLERPAQTLEHVWEFLGVPVMDVEPLPAPADAPQRPADPADQQYLRTVFEHEVRQLERMLEWDCADWLG